MKTSPNGAILQRDGKTWAITTRIPAGIVTPDDLEKISSVGRKYQIPILKITSGQRIMLAGIKGEDVTRVIEDLGPLAKPEAGPCVKFAQACLGTDMCRWGSQDSISLARLIENNVKDRTFPAKIKIGVSGCQRCCCDSQTRDIGIIGTTGGWMIFFGGNGGTRPRFGDLIAWGLTSAETIDCVERLLDYYSTHANSRERTARFMERIGLDTLKSELLSIIPYIPVER